MTDARLHFPATERNRDAILGVLRDVFPASATVLEVASGSGEHGAYFAQQEPGWTWIPSDPEPSHVASANAWQASEAVANLRPAVQLDVLGEWPSVLITAAFCANMIHISPPETTPALFQGWARLLPTGAPAVLYGPFQRQGTHTSVSNARFHESLRSRDPRWGVRHLEAVEAAAEAAGLTPQTVVEMPANNLCVVFRRG